ncbi:recombinase family protein [Ligilactobacillus animalis]|uniref:recombinase family protein n=1 Tax=Ligilactobacillus animalis TaxID=1605 RepID=UPI00082432E3|nr:recombinase family protein [Ligilactobacillus animalis]OCX48039.1 serine recombinase [Ligilactobacillus animalis]QHQ70396.1 recombinase family protein [Ligilactobacillus animalis]
MPNKKMKIIPARRHIGSKPVPFEEDIPKLRVAAYCRVSTEYEEQNSSYQTQVSHYTNYILNHDGWDLVNVYADDGISGTNTKKREQFNQMIEDCMAGKIDLIITKSISRFARNTLDCLHYIRQLKEKNIAVYFEKENIKTTDAKGEVLLTIMASLAQQESQSLSQNVKLGLQYRYQQGKVMVNHNWFLGYTKDEEGHLIVDPEQAKIVKRIYYEYLEGYSCKQIARRLTTDGIPNGAGNTKWGDSNIASILKNEKYIGDALLQKSYTIDFLTKKRIRNQGIMPQYYIKDDHEAIIPKDLFRRVQEERKRRRAGIKVPCGKTRHYNNRTCFSLKVFCGRCGDIYHRVAYNYSDENGQVVKWLCMTGHDHDLVTCHGRAISERQLKEVCLRAFNKIIEPNKIFQAKLQNNIRHAINQVNEEQATKLDRELDRLQILLINQTPHSKDYDKISDEFNRIQQQRDELQLTLDRQNEVVQKNVNLQNFIDINSKQLNEFDEHLVRQLIKKITIQETYCEVEFQNGDSIKINL